MKQRLDFPVLGMTCAACASRVERKLSKAPGVAAAAVNYGTEKATVEFDPGATDAGALVAAVRGAGYDARTETVTLEIEGLEWAVSGEPSG